jgi:glutamate-5-semialdehyde dehydrogenase
MGAPAPSNHNNMITTRQKDKVLATLAALLAQNQQVIIKANQEDVAKYNGQDESMLDRLKVGEKKVQGMISAVQQAMALKDPEGKVLYAFEPENGLRIENRTVPFGNILIIYESRPDVTIEASITAFKAGNNILLKGGKEARTTNLALMALWQQALSENGLSQDLVSYLDLNREDTQQLIKNNTHQVDLIIPRGGEGLINFVRQNTSIPIIISGRGNNFLFIDQTSDFDMAVDIILDGKKRISVCNALDKVLLHENLPAREEKVAFLIDRLHEAGIEVLGSPAISDFHNNIITISGSGIYDEEFLAPKIFLSIVKDLPEAIKIINTHSGKHSASIVSSDARSADRFLNEVDCAAVYHNASTRFTDGGEFGFGAEMAISTQKLHFRGPVAIDQLVTNKWFIFGNGQTRG